MAEEKKMKEAFLQQSIQVRSLRQAWGWSSRWRPT